MKMSLDQGEGAYRIRTYEPGRILVNDHAYTASLLLSPEVLVDDWPPQHIDALALEHMEAVLALEPELVLLGTGEDQRFPAREIMRAMVSRNIGIEVMDTGSAARTFNVVMAEGRRVVAALMP